MQLRTKVTEKFQITLLKHLRTGVKPGDEFEIERKNGTFIFKLIKVNRE